MSQKPPPPRQRGAQPGNTNALKSGIYSPRLDDAFPPLTPTSTPDEVLAAGEFVQSRCNALVQAASRGYGRRRQALQARATRLALGFLLQVAGATGGAAVPCQAPGPGGRLPAGAQSVPPGLARLLAALSTAFPPPHQNQPENRINE